MAARKKQSPKESLHISSLSLTPVAEKALKRLSQDATDYIGRSVSSSAVVRALILYADDQLPIWLYEKLFPLIEGEFKDGMVWGKRKS